jgi:hypothetical protein
MRGPSGNFKGGKGECVNVPATTVCNTNAYVFDQRITNDADLFISGVTVQWSPNGGVHQPLQPRLRLQQQRQQDHHSHSGS